MKYAGIYLPGCKHIAVLMFKLYLQCSSIFYFFLLCRAVVE